MGEYLEPAFEMIENIEDKDVREQYIKKLSELGKEPYAIITRSILRDARENIMENEKYSSFWEKVVSDPKNKRGVE